MSFQLAAVRNQSYVKMIVISFFHLLVKVFCVTSFRNFFSDLLPGGQYRCLGRN